MSRKEDELVTSAIATYICVQARKRHTMIIDINVGDIADKLDAGPSQIDKAKIMARGLLREFL